MRFLLWPFSLIFQFFAWLRIWLYSVGLFKYNHVGQPVLCIGNLTTGGTGKTPWVQWVTQYLFSKDIKTVILSRGYSGDFDGVLEVTESMDPRKCGDEPLWLKRNTEASVYVGRSRTNAAKEAIAGQKPDVLVLDDGFQHLKLRRQFDLVLIDVSAPEWHYSFLPMGRMRENFSALKRAQAVIFNKCNYAEKESLENLLARCQPYVKSENTYFADYLFSDWEALVPGLSIAMNTSNVSMTCGVGNPGAFLKTIEEQELSPVKKFIYPDHYFWKPEDIEKMTYHMKQASCRDLLITEKDAVKLVRYKKHFFEMKIQLWVCRMSVSFRSNEERLKSHILQIVGGSR